MHARSTSSLLAATLLTTLGIAGCGADPSTGEVTDDSSTPEAQPEAVLHRGCGTVEPSDAQKAAIEQHVLNTVKPGLAVTGGTIPVYWHVINNMANSPSNGDILDAKITASINVLNAAYGPWGWTFTLAGTTRTTHPTWYTMGYNSTAESQAKAALRQGGKDALNVYSANLPSPLLGWATFPWSYAGNATADGVVILFSSVPGGTMTLYNEGDTLTHEVGHWMGLYHTFQGGCTTSWSLSDMVADTPAGLKGANCPIGLDSCPTIAGNDPNTNFMAYSIDLCKNTFSAGQDARMDAQFTVYRACTPRTTCFSGECGYVSDECGGSLYCECNPCPGDYDYCGGSCCFWGTNCTVCP